MLERKLGVILYFMKKATRIGLVVMGISVLTITIVEKNFIEFLIAALLTGFSISLLYELSGQRS